MDHLVTWICIYIHTTYHESRAQEILDDIDHRIACTPPFSGLRRFPQGRGFKQWTGDDTKALMKVYLPAITGHVPFEMVRAVAAVIDFCYLVRRSVQDEHTLAATYQALQQFLQYREIFRTTGVRTDFNLPRQHAMLHYPRSIPLFGAPNGLCSSITESRHIKAVKIPWRQSNRYNALGQMLVHNQRQDKLAASRVNFTTRGMLQPLDFHDVNVVVALDADSTERC